MKYNENFELNEKNLEDIAIQTDDIILKGELRILEKHTKELAETKFLFASAVDEARFLYIMGNCYQVLYNNREMEWYSDQLSKAVIFFRRSLNILDKLSLSSQETLYLKSCVETNLANSLSAQGRVLCCIPLWDKAIHKKNPIAIICKAQNELYLAKVLYDPGHQEYHLLVAYRLIILGLEYKDRLYEEEQNAFHESGEFMRFKNWFESNHSESDFIEFEEQTCEFDTRKQKQYLQWCASNALFINDLNDILSSEVVYQDIISLPSFRFALNKSLSMHEELMYHGNFDELKNDFCYARYIFYTALNIPQDTKHFFNDTYPHVEDMSHSLINLKPNHYKSAFRVLYSLFDKVSYFLHRFLELNDIKDDNKISFDAIFRDISKKEKWVPNPRLKNSKNPFIHALFYLLKDIRDVKDATPTTRWLDPEAKSFVEIRNAIEHRSLKIIDDFGYTLTQSDKDYTSMHLQKYITERDECISNLKQLHHKIKKIKIEGDLDELSRLTQMKLELETKEKQLKSLIDEKQKMSTHSILITVSEFESRTLTLMKIARNSIIYLALALHFEEQNKPKSDGFVMPTEVPLR